MTTATAADMRAMNVAEARETLYRDARSAQQCGESAAEWEESVAADHVMANCAHAIGPKELRAIECMVWKIDRGTR